MRNIKQTDDQPLKYRLMKVYKKSAPGKLLIRFDMELKSLLTNDLKSFLAKNPFFARNKQDKEQSSLFTA